MNPKDRIDSLLKEKNLFAEYLEIFNRLIVTVKNDRGELVWSMRSTNALLVRDSILDFLEDYRPTTFIQESEPASSLSYLPTHDEKQRIRSAES